VEVVVVKEEEEEEGEEEKQEAFDCFEVISAQTSSSAVAKASMCLESNSWAKRRISEEQLRPLVVFLIRCMMKLFLRVQCKG